MTTSGGHSHHNHNVGSFDNGLRTDEEVMEAIREGDRKALQLLVDRYWARLVSKVGSMTGSGDAAEDIAQEVFVRVWKYRERWTAGGAASHYLFRIARNLALDRALLQKIRDRKEIEVRNLNRKSPLPLEEVEYLELRRAFDAAVQRLPYRRREAFLLIRVEGFTLCEAADVMGVARQTVANHVQLASTELREVLADFLAQ
jgi:RNA polymerase sigma-70 factor (ECF subfamily)